MTCAVLAISIHSPRMGRDRPYQAESIAAIISIHSPRMGRDGHDRAGNDRRVISIHSPRMGRDAGAWIRFNPLDDFNPLSPHGERPPCSSMACIWVHFNPLSPHGERQQAHAGPKRACNFNPLSPHGERPTPAPRNPWPKYFNPLSPHGERRGGVCRRPPARAFQSTLPAWGETAAFRRNAMQDASFQSTLHAGGETRTEPEMRPLTLISIHSPRMGRDLRPAGSGEHGDDFNPLSPHGERHAIAGPLMRCHHFNPLSPHGERPSRRALRTWCWKFQSTLPAWGETGARARAAAPQPISIHSPRMGRDDVLFQLGFHFGDFNPLSPHGERPARLHVGVCQRHISIHSPRMGRDVMR